MGTRSTISFYENEKHMVSIYQQFDGYLACVGRELYTFLNSKQLVNGITSRHDRTKIANGSGCLAAQFIASLKSEPGNVYIEQSGNGERKYGEPSEYDQEFNYHVNIKVDWERAWECSFDIEVCVFGYAYKEAEGDEKGLEGLIFKGSLNEYSAFLKEWA